MLHHRDICGEGAPIENPHVIEDQSEVADFLSDPATHGPEVTDVKRIDTHGAMVFLAGTRAYKIKRAVRYPYMDFSTLERRREACEREVALNRRTAPDLYLGVVPISHEADGTLALGGDGAVVEWAVAMRRFEQEDLLDRKAEAGALDADIMRDVADAVATFHAGAERIDGEAARAMKWVIDENAEEFAERSDLFKPDDVDGLTAAATAEHARCAAMLDARGAAGFVRRCHGDLHLRNVFLLDGRATLFDAIEFNDALACIDVFYDLAFLLMDLDQRNLRPFGNLVLNRYLLRTDDIEGLATLPLFLSARAAVRAKTSASAEAAQDDADTAAALRQRAKSYFRAARDYLNVEPARLVAVGGLSGTGKSTVAARLAPALGSAPGALHLRSDLIRKRLWGVDERERLPEAAYAPEEGERVYCEITRCAKRALEAGHSVIVDAVYAKPAERDVLSALAERVGVPFSGLWLEAPAETLVSRVGARKGDASDADAGVVQQQLSYDLGALSWRWIDADRPIDAVAADCLAATQA